MGQMESTQPEPPNPVRLCVFVVSINGCNIQEATKAKAPSAYSTPLVSLRKLGP